MPNPSRALCEPPTPRPVRRLPRPFRSLFAIVVTLAITAAPVRAQQQGAADEVRLVVTVSDGKGNYLTGLERWRFTVLEGKEARAITSFDSSYAPASVGVLIDVSGSMSDRSNRSARPALNQLFLKGHPENQYFVSEFNTQPRLVEDWTGDPSRLASALDRIGAGLGEARAKGNTALYDSCAAALDKLAEGRHAKRVLVVVSDGQDNLSRMAFNELRRRLRSSGVLVYCVGLAERHSPDALEMGGQYILAELAAQTGGAALFPESRKGMTASIESIAVELRHQYVVGFAPTPADGNTAEPKWRKIRIKVESPWQELKKLVVRSRGGYFFPRAVR